LLELGFFFLLFLTINIVINPTITANIPPPTIKPVGKLLLDLLLSPVDFLLLRALTLAKLFLASCKYSSLLRISCLIWGVCGSDFSSAISSSNSLIFFSRA